ncbi:hypothetical protein IEQ34_000549 [Dendrobium chrysotoxum]|uniref:Uncharacterized protein n=1 Tax=Dendrobium chrysotoxum TaxID=161865 RepID=A0AAV7HQ74_DENCH|nr:hypothetical protein IEQ34_000549 [Dendrobium chrysotoxum]
MKVIKNNLYKPRANSRPLERSATALAAFNSLELVEECGVDVMPRVFIGPKGYCYTYMMPCWVSILMEVIGNNLYEPRDNSSFALETDGLSSREVKCRKWVRETIETVIVRKPKMEEGPMPYYLQVMPIVFIGPKRLELSIWLSSSEVEYKKWVRETNEIVVVKKPKMEEGLVPYYLQVMPMVYIGPKGYCYAYMMPC